MHNQSIINKFFSESWVLDSSTRVWRRRGWSLLGWGWVAEGHRCVWVLLALAEGVWLRECWGVFGGSRDLVILSSGENRVDWNDEVVHKRWPLFFFTSRIVGFCGSGFSLNLHTLVFFLSFPPLFNTPFLPYGLVDLT